MSGGLEGAISGQPPAALPSVVASVTEVAPGAPTDGGGTADTTAASEESSDGGGIDGVKAAVSLVVVGFAGVMSYIGLQGTDLTTVMRNQSSPLQLMGLFVLLAVVTALLSVFVKELSMGRLTVGMQVTILLGQLALFPLIEAVTPLPSGITSVTQRIVAFAVAGALAIVAVAVCASAMPLTAHTRSGLVEKGDAPLALPVNGASGPAQSAKHIEPLGPEAALRIWRLLRRPAGNTHLYLFLLVVSLIFTSLAVYTGLRLELRNQLDAGVGLQATLKETGTQGVVNLAVSAQHLAIEDEALVMVNAVPSKLPTGRALSIASICKRNYAPGDVSSCESDPCDSNGINCQTLLVWGLPPDATGVVNTRITFPFSAAAYQWLQVVSYTCKQTPSAANCSNLSGVYNGINLAVPSS
jgi:hypothetical protein